ncbi:MAG: type II secretion system protein [Candidatus Omnitrophica bacterium]|nr:type II secretion system protein [Candidatus Omnitrophota bacterium]
MFERMKNKNKAFTLIELVMVIVIISVLAVIIIPKFVGQRAQAEIASTKANLESLRTAIQMYYANEGGAYPAALGSLTSAGPVTGETYMRKIPVPTVKNSDGDTADAFTYDSTTGAVSVNLTGTDANGDTIADY